MGNVYGVDIFFPEDGMMKKRMLKVCIIGDLLQRDDLKIEKVHYFIQVYS
jgi:hypothetical protein